MGTISEVSVAIGSGVIASVKMASGYWGKALGKLSGRIADDSRAVLDADVDGVGVGLGVGVNVGVNVGFNVGVVVLALGGGVCSEGSARKES